LGQAFGDVLERRLRYYSRSDPAFSSFELERFTPPGASLAASLMILVKDYRLGALGQENIAVLEVFPLCKRRGYDVAAEESGDGPVVSIFLAIQAAPEVPFMHSLKYRQVK
jgi:hypothetical protein